MAAIDRAGMPQRFLDDEPIRHEWRQWNVAFHVRDPLPGWPRPYQAALCATGDAAYAKSGRDRPATPNATVQVTLEGEGEFLHHGRRLPLPAGTAFVTRLNDATVAYRYPPGATLPWRFVFLDFAGGDALVDGLVARHGHVVALGLDAPVVARLVHLASGEQGRLRHLDLDAGAAAQLVLDLLAALADAHRARQGAAPEARLVARALAVLADRPERPLATRDLARDLGVSPEHLCRAFRRATGETPQACRRRMQMRQACALMADRGLDADACARRLGYRDRANFGKAFRAVVGETPARWLRRGGLPPR